MSHLIKDTYTYIFVRINLPRMSRIVLYLFVTAMVLPGCRNLNPSVMFKTPEDYNFQVDQTIGNIEYRIAPNDILEVSVFTNDGFKLVDLTATTGLPGTGSTDVGESAVQYKVEIDGYVKLPIIQKVKIRDMTVREAEKYLEQQYATYYTKPFVLMKVVNRRVLVFPGQGGTGRVINLLNENTSLIEALALAGGIATTGKAYRIKLIRGDYRNPSVQIIDLSTVEGMKQSNLLLQANDIIYVEPIPKIAQGVLAEITPIVGIITSFFLVYNIIVTQNK